MVTPPTHLLPTPEHLRLGPDPAVYLRRVLEHVANSAPNVFYDAAQKRETYYLTALAALAALASTHDEAAAIDLFHARCAELPTGKSTASAPPDELRRYTLAYHGLARDRAERGPAARSLTKWLEAADAAIAAYRGQVLQPA